MAYRKRLTYDEIAPYVQKMLTLLRQNAPAILDEQDPEVEAFFVDHSVRNKFIEEFRNLWAPLSAAGMLHSMPIDAQRAMVIFDPKAKGPIPTVSPTHIRLVKLSHLICLTPQDFFKVLRLIATAKNTPTKDSLSLNPAGIGIHDLGSTLIGQYFTKLRLNYRMNPEYTDKKWTPRALIESIADADPTRDNQLAAMQAITWEQNEDLFGLPSDSAIALELDFEETERDYCTIKRFNT